jgi:hypothetical protein
VYLFLRSSAARASMLIIDARDVSGKATRSVTAGAEAKRDTHNKNIHFLKGTNKESYANIIY